MERAARRWKPRRRRWLRPEVQSALYPADTPQRPHEAGEPILISATTGH
jgi:hypothetical protein